MSSWTDFMYNTAIRKIEWTALKNFTQCLHLDPNKFAAEKIPKQQFESYLCINFNKTVTWNRDRSLLSVGIKADPSYWTDMISHYIHKVPIMVVTNNFSRPYWQISLVMTKPIRTSWKTLSSFYPEENFHLTTEEQRTYKEWWV